MKYLIAVLLGLVGTAAAQNTTTNGTSTSSMAPSTSVAPSTSGAPASTTGAPPGNGTAPATTAAPGTFKVGLVITATVQLSGTTTGAQVDASASTGDDGRVVCAAGAGKADCDTVDAGAVAGINTASGQTGWYTADITAASRRSLEEAQRRRLASASLGLKMEILLLTQAAGDTLKTSMKTGDGIGASFATAFKASSGYNVTVTDVGAITVTDTSSSGGGSSTSGAMATFGLSAAALLLSGMALLM